MEHDHIQNSNGVPINWEIPTCWSILFDIQEVEIIKRMPLDERRQVIYKKVAEADHNIQAARLRASQEIEASLSAKDKAAKNETPAPDPR